MCCSPSLRAFQLDYMEFILKTFVFSTHNSSFCFHCICICIEKVALILIAWDDKIMIIILNCLLALRFIFFCFLFAIFENRMNVKHKRDKNGSYLQMGNPFVHFLVAKSKVEYRYDPKMTVSKMRFDCLCTLQYYFGLLFYHLSTSFLLLLQFYYIYSHISCILCGPYLLYVAFSNKCND